MSAVTSIMRVHQILMARLNDQLGPYGLTFPRYEALMLLFYHPVVGSPHRQAWVALLVRPPERGCGGPPETGGELIHGPEPRTHRKQPNGPDEFVARGWSKLVTP